MNGALEKGERCLGILDILPGKPTRLVLYLEPSVVHPMVTALLVGQGKGGKEVLEGHVPVCVDGREDKGIGLVRALSLFALDVVEAPRPRHDGRSVHILVALALVLLRVALCVCLWQGCRGKEDDHARARILECRVGSPLARVGTSLALPCWLQSQLEVYVWMTWP